MRTGRPPLGEQKLVRCTVYLTPEQLQTAHRQGDGNVSDGLRRQLDSLVELLAWHKLRLAETPAPAPVPRSRHQ